MESLVERLKRSNNALMQNEAEGVELFKNLRHNKQGLDFFLANTIAEILLESKSVLICTSNPMLVSKFIPAKENGRPTHPDMDMFKTNPRHNPLTWDLLKNKMASISGNGWQIVNFIIVKDNNVEMLHHLTNELLHRKEQ